mgnify:FL=1|jgi:putative protein-disulfide isomerase
MNSQTLYYVYDPMCSWCWGFEKTWLQVKKSLPKSITIIYILGGLAPDSKEIMSDEMRQYIQANWLKIQQTIPGTQFNFDFWKNCSPMRSTYPACRAVIAAKNQGLEYELSMLNAIQNAYYLQAKNPSIDLTLIELAHSLNLNIEQFTQDLNSIVTRQQLLDDITLAKSLRVISFPSLLLSSNKGNKPIAIDYNNAKLIINQILA